MSEVKQDANDSLRLSKELGSSFLEHRRFIATVISNGNRVPKLGLIETMMSLHSIHAVQNKACFQN